MRRNRPQDDEDRPPHEEDRFGDLGAPPSEVPAEVPEEPPRGGSAAARLAELDEPPPPPPRRVPASSYSWVVGVAFLIVVVVAGANALRSEGPGARGLERGATLPVFAAPLATSGEDKDANVKQQAGDSDSAGRRPACEVRGPEIVNLCELRERPLVIAFLFTRAADCTPQFDRMERIRREFPRVSFAGVIIREPIEKAGRLVREHGWGFPVAVDRDGQVSNLYGVGGCPTTTFAHRGGQVRETRLGTMTEQQLRAAVRRLR